MSVVQEFPFSEEWRRLKSLRSYVHRLLNLTTYQPLDKSRLLSDKIGTQNDNCLLEDGLRLVMRRNDLNGLLDHGLDAKAQDQASASLTSLCEGLERTVATNLWAEPFSVGESKYPKFDRLLHELSSTEWLFHMASGSLGRELFIATNLNSFKGLVDSFNALFDRLTQPEVQVPEVHGIEQAREENADAPSVQTRRGVAKLQALLRWLENFTSTTCSGRHDVLLQLPEWDVATSRERFPKPHLDLYLSCCTPSKWQESHLHEFSDSNHGDWYPVDNLCDEIDDLCNRERLTLAVADDKIYAYAGLADGSDSPTLSNGKPPQTLKNLIQSGAFLGPDIWWSKTKSFEQTEKRKLAATLVLSCSLNTEESHLITLWDPASVYFLLDSQGKCMHNLPYGLCLRSVVNESTEPHFLNDNEHELRFAFLARLLMEIECGISLEHMRLSVTGHLHGSTDTLEDFIYDQLSVDLQESRRVYLEAVQMCFKFQQHCRREYKRICAQGRRGSREAAAKNVAYRIVQKILKAANWGTHSSDFDRAPFQPQPASHLSAIFQSEQIGDSSISLSFPPTTPAPSMPGGITAQKKLQVNIRKQVNFSENDLEEETEQNTTPGVLRDSPVAFGDDCELFGNAGIRGNPKDLCQSANKWIREFKKLRQKKTDVHNKQRIKVAVLDTGVDITHPDIVGNVYDHKSFIGENATVDDSGHGTHIAGIILDLTTNVDLYVGQVIKSRLSEDRRPIIDALIHARTVWEVDMISLSFGFRISGNPDLVQKEIEACLKHSIAVFASASNDAGNKPRTYPGDYDGVLCIHSATGSGNASSYNPSPEPRMDNFSFLGDCVKSCWPMGKLSLSDDERDQRYLSGTSIATPVAVSVAVFMINYIRKEFPEYHWNIKPWSPNGVRKIFALLAHEREGYDWVSPEYVFTGDQNREEEIKAKIKKSLRAYIPKAL